MTSDGVFRLQIAPIASLLDGAQSALNPQGPGASEIAALTWLLFFGAAAIFAAVIALAAYALFARRDVARGWPAREFIVAAGIVFPLVVLTALLIRALLPTRKRRQPGIRLAAHRSGRRAMVVAGPLSNADGGHEFATANEIRIPVGRPVELSLRSADVIHSFWVPKLAGQARHDSRARQPSPARGRPGRRVSRPMRGVLRRAARAHGVVRDRRCVRDEFEAWRAQQQRPATRPATPSAERGRTVIWRAWMRRMPWRARNRGGRARAVRT